MSQTGLFVLRKSKTAECEKNAKWTIPISYKLTTRTFMNRPTDDTCFVHPFFFYLDYTLKRNKIKLKNTNVRDVMKN